MTIILSDTDTIMRLTSLVDDLARIEAGEGPTRQDLAAAPIIDGWRLAARSEVCLTGRITGHPTLGDPRNGRTSILFAMDREAGWIRSLSRWYRLGVQAPSNPAGREQ